MKFALQVKSLACGSLMLCAMASSFGLTWGRAQGAVFVGKKLDVRMQMQLDNADGAQSACLGAEVFYGDTQLDAERVSVRLEPGDTNPTNSATVRVQASVVVDEPIVTVQLHAGCNHPMSRRYTLLPDVAAQVVQPTVAVLAARIATATEVAAVPPARSIATVGKPNAIATTQARPLALNVRPNGRSRLKLDPLDLQIERDPVLRASNEMATLPQENAQRRAEAAALWRSLNASPEDVLREDAKALALARDLKVLYGVTTENQKGLMALAAQVQQAESERYANAWVYSLATLCLCGLLALAWVGLRWRSARQTHWSDGFDAEESVLDEWVQAGAPSRHSALAAQPAPPAVPTPLAADPVAVPKRWTDVDFDLDLMLPPVKASEPSAADAALPAHAINPSQPPQTASQSPARDFSLSVASGLRAIDSEELVDIRQQAEFFVSLGQHQKAIDVLTTRIVQCGQSSPLLCLDLLKIYHALGRESEFEAVRAEFNNWFTGRVPRFADFGDEGVSLEQYPQVVRRIMALWPEPAVLEYIEACLYRHSAHAEWPGFDLRAYRDLLLLYGVAKRLVRLKVDAGDSHSSELVRIPPPFDDSATGSALDAAGAGSAVVHRAGAQFRGGWKRKLVRVPLPNLTEQPQANAQTGSSAWGAMNAPMPSRAAALPPLQATNDEATQDATARTHFDFRNFS